MLMAETFPHIDFRREVTIGHLLADYDTATGTRRQGEPADPLARGRRGAVGHVLAGEHRLGRAATTPAAGDEMKFGEPRDDVFVAKSGFGGAEYLLPGADLRGPPPRARATTGSRELTSWQSGPALRPADARATIAARLRRRRRAGRPGRALDDQRRRVAVDAGVHAVRGDDAGRERRPHLPARPPDPRRRRDRGRAVRPVPQPPAAVSAGPPTAATA